MNTQVELHEMINTELQAAYTGESNVTLTQALARICAELYDVRLKYDRESGQYKEHNNLGYAQMVTLSTLANSIWSQMYDTRVNSQGYVKGTAHKLDNATAKLKRVAKQCDGTEIALQEVKSVKDWVERLQGELAIMDEMYHTIANVMEVATGRAHKPLQPWTTAPQAQPEANVEADILASELAAMGISLGSESKAYVPETDGVGDGTNVSGRTNDKDEAAEQKRKKRQSKAA